MSNEVTGRDFGRLESKVDGIGDDVREILAKFDELEDRTRVLESAQAYTAGRNAVISFLIAAITAAGGGWLARNL